MLFEIVFQLKPEDSLKTPSCDLMLFEIVFQLADEQQDGADVVI